MTTLASIRVKIKKLEVEIDELKTEFEKLVKKLLRK